MIKKPLEDQANSKPRNNLRSPKVLSLNYWFKYVQLRDIINISSSNYNIIYINKQS